MGYTHYWTHKSRFTTDEWRTIREDINSILTAATESGIVLGDTSGDSPLAAFNFIDGGDSVIGFNGLGDESHETFMIYQKRRPLDAGQDKSRHGCDFCKTERKAYDVAVTACLVYLESYYPKKFLASSDGNVTDWQAGLALAKQALPRLANVLHVPTEIEWDSNFRAYPISGNRLFIAETIGGEIVIADHKRRAILARFPAGAVSQDVAARVLAMKARDPSRNGWAKVDAVARWADRQCRTLLQAAPMLGGNVQEPA